MTLAAHSDLAIIAGLLAVLFLGAAPLLRERKAILVGQFLAGLAFTVYYAALGVTVAALVNVLSRLQNGAAMTAISSRAGRWLGYGLAGAMVAVGVAFWQGPVSGLSVAAMSLIALGRMQTNTLYLRLMILAGGVFWLVHDSLSSAWIAFAAGCAGLSMGLVGLWLYCRPQPWMKRRRPAKTSKILQNATALASLRTAQPGHGSRAKLGV